MPARYGHSGAGGGHQDQGERKDDGWKSSQGGRESRQPGRRGQPEGEARKSYSSPPPGTNTQGHLAGIGEAAEQSAQRLGPAVRPVPEADEMPPPVRRETTPEERIREGLPEAERDRKIRLPNAREGTDQPPRMGGPLGPDPEDPHLPEGAQTSETRGTGARGFDQGVDAKRIGEVHQGARAEDPRDATGPGEPGAIEGGPPRGR
ncbi:MAG: hypothetical protein FIA92_09580 [Chloroflexi bacterium]|nr:hypothetical protein [Chloroflexota bacterium]